MATTDDGKQPIEYSLDLWHKMIASRDLSDLLTIVYHDVVFRSPMAHSPYNGKQALRMALSTVLNVFEDFKYHRHFKSDDGLNVTLEFSAVVNGKALKGVDLIRFDEEGLIREFEVMVRPMSGLVALGEEMGKRIGTPLQEFK